MSNSPDRKENNEIHLGSLFEDFDPTSREEWEHQIEADLKGADYKERLAWHTKEGFNMLPFYMREDLESITFAKKHPGSYPYTRGHKENSTSWKIGQLIGAQDIDEVRQEIKNALENGCDALYIPFKLGSKNNENEFKLQGPDLQKQALFKELFDNGKRESLPLMVFECGNATPYLTAGFANLIEESENDSRILDLHFLWDPLTEKAFANGDIFKGGTGFEQLYKGIEFTEQITNKEPAGLKMLGINAKKYHNAGANAVQEMAFGLSIANDYLANLTEYGLSLETLLDHLFFTFATGSSYFKEIAKLRAVRFLWAHILSRYGLQGNGQPHLPIYSFTSKWNKTLYEPYTNLLRTTTEGMSATVGGCDLLVIQPFDQTFRNPNEFSLHLARNQQHLLKEEAYFGEVQDPAGGSYYIEKLTQKLAEKAWDLFVEIEEQGGFTKALDTGFILEQVEQIRNEQRTKIATRKQVRVGINDYPNPDAKALDYMSDDKDFARSISLSNVKQDDNTTGIDSDTNTNIFSKLQNQLKNGKTLAECIATNYTVEQGSDHALTESTETKEFEELRLQTELHTQTTGERPNVLMVPVGHPKWRAARANFAANVFGIAGYDIHKPLAFESIDEVVEAYTEQHPDLLVVCSSDKEYESFCPDLSQTLRSRNIFTTLVLAGHPGDKKEFYEDHDISYFVHKGMDVLNFLKHVQQQLGVSK